MAEAYTILTLSPGSTSTKVAVFKGEQLQVVIAGRFIKTEWFHDTDMNHQTDNGDGMHVIHTGGEHDSYLQIPVVPPKYQVGDYVYRG